MNAVRGTIGNQLILHRQNVCDKWILLCENPQNYKQYSVIVISDDTIENRKLFSRFGHAWMSFINLVHRYRIIYE